MVRIVRTMSVRFLLALLVSLWLPLAAYAHAEFRGSEPPQNSLLEALPPSVSLRFSEQVGALVLEWLLPDGSVSTALAEAGAEVMTVASPSDGGQGTYVLRWRVASADGHPVSGSLVFSVGEVGGVTPKMAADSGPVPSVIARGVFVASLVLSVGAAFFHHAVARLEPETARLAARTTWLVLPLGLIWVAVEGTELLGLGIASALSVAAMKGGLQSPVLFTVTLASLASVLAFLALQRGSRISAFAALGIAALSFSVSGHALSAPGSLAPALTAFHAAALIIWVGGLIPLVLAMRMQTRLQTLSDFSLVAFPAVVVLLISGAALVLLRRESPDLLASGWIRLLATKLGLVAAMLVLALWHRFRVMPQLAKRGMSRVVRSIAIEAACGLIVLGLAMGFRLAPPPSLAEAPIPNPAYLHIHSDKAMAVLIATAPFPGSTGFRLTLTDDQFTPIDPKEVALTLTDPVAGIGPLTTQGRKVGLGEWEIPSLTLPTPGPWDVRISLLISTFDQITLTGKLLASDPSGQDE